MNPISSDRGISLFATALDGLAAQQQAIANNIANVETPGYKRQSVPFAELMRKAVNDGGVSMAATTEGHIGAGGTIAGPGRFTQVMDVMTAGKNDGNTVEIEREITDLTENQLKYYTVAQAMSAKLGVLRDIVTRAT